MLLPQLLTLTLAVAPALVEGAIFSKNSLVKMLDPPSFRAALKENRTMLVAFIAPWCGHCQKMAPEYEKAALGLYPLVPTYAVDCDRKSNKKLCAQQGVQGFPTVKLFPRGASQKPILYEHGERSGSAFYYWAQRNIPHGVKKLYNLPEIQPWLDENIDHNRALLLNQGKHIPLLWQTLGVKYGEHFKFAIHRDRGGKSSEAMGLEKGEKGSGKVLLYLAGSKDYFRYEGVQKWESLSKFFDSVIDGTADLNAVIEEAKNEEWVPDETELEIKRQQDEQKMKLAHGGMAGMPGFEEMMKGPNPHGAGFGDPPRAHAGGDAQQPLQAQKKEKQAPEKGKAQPKKKKGESVSMFTPKGTGQPQTATLASAVGSETARAKEEL